MKTFNFKSIAEITEEQETTSIYPYSKLKVGDAFGLTPNQEEEALANIQFFKKQSTLKAKREFTIIYRTREIYIMRRIK